MISPFTRKDWRDRILAKLESVPTSARVFVLRRHADVTGVSGTGVVADGVIFPDGKVATRWRGAVAQTCAWDRLSHVREIHGHNGATTVETLPDLAHVLAELVSREISGNCDCDGCIGTLETIGNALGIRDPHADAEIDQALAAAVLIPTAEETPDA